ncbi:MAG: hypothetical protein IT372_35955 [Polyangiaceae bacterium]|nr:hypothetical protein [Polyangiaceae bacterium]
MRTTFLFSASLVSLLALEGAALAVELKNDGFVDGAAASFQGGFAMGEVGASRFTPPASGAHLLGVQFLFGGAPGTKDITLHVWDDSGLQDDPGTELFSGDYTLTAADDQMQAVDLSGDNVIVPGTFRVGIYFKHTGYPGIASDADGTIDSSKNYIRSNDLGWVPSDFYGVSGDWIIRAEVSGGSGGGSSSSSSSSSGTGSGGSGAGGPGECQGNQDCPIGQYCNEAGACTLDCRVNSDCPAGNICNSLGQCVAGAAAADGSSGDDGGCSTAPGGGAAAMAGLLGGLAALAAALRRRLS